MELAALDGAEEIERELKVMREARERMISCNLRLVLHIARKSFYSGGSGGLKVRVCRRFGGGGGSERGVGGGVRVLHITRKGFCSGGSSFLKVRKGVLEGRGAGAPGEGG